MAKHAGTFSISLTGRLQCAGKHARAQYVPMPTVPLSAPALSWSCCCCRSPRAAAVPPCPARSSLLSCSSRLVTSLVARLPRPMPPYEGMSLSRGRSRPKLGTGGATAPGASTASGEDRGTGRWRPAPGQGRGLDTGHRERLSEERRHSTGSAGLTGATAARLQLQGREMSACEVIRNKHSKHARCPVQHA